MTQGPDSSKPVPVGKTVYPGAPFGSSEGKRFFPIRNILTRAVWNVVWGLLASWTPPQLHAWRRMLLTLFGAKIAPTARVYGSAKIWLPANLEMGEGAVMGWGVNCYCMDRIVIEKYAIVSQYAHLVAGSHDVDSHCFDLITRPVHIGAYAWIASCAFVGPGVSVGEGAVLAGCGVAFRDLAPWTIYAGNPAVSVRQRKNFLPELAAV